mmetsp:Transcript_64851/g.167436  ORF Transcript_64851/g.167436 Transcript_64851/m.167436 type:complete len:276 (-) Transcript_64851:872-1699(-)
MVAFLTGRPAVADDALGTLLVAPQLRPVTSRGQVPGNREVVRLERVKLDGGAAGHVLGHLGYPHRLLVATICYSQPCRLRVLINLLPRHCLIQHHRSGGCRGGRRHPLLRGLLVLQHGHGAAGLAGRAVEDHLVPCTSWTSANTHPPVVVVSVQARAHLTHGIHETRVFKLAIASVQRRTTVARDAVSLFGLHPPFSLRRSSPNRVCQLAARAVASSDGRPCRVHRLQVHVGPELAQVLPFGASVHRKLRAIDDLLIVVLVRIPGVSAFAIALDN